jgi:hypothetical protein
MTHRRIHKLIWLLLPLFALRGVVPVGFMVNVSGGELSMAVCPMHQTVELGQSDLAAKDGKSSPSESTKSQCPFAAALSSATFVGVSTTAQVSAAVGGFSLDETAVTHAAFGPSRAQQSRAPPRYS